MSRAVSARIDGIVESMSEFVKVISEEDLDLQDLDEYCNFFAGNPQEMASREYVEVLQRWAEPLDKDWYGYKMSHRPAQEAAAEGLSKELGIEFDPGDILLARGAHGALGAALAAVVDPGDEVIFISPPWFFYEAMILGVGAIPVKTKVTPANYDLDLEAIAQAITPRTRMILLNTPHNPTGRIFPAESLKGLAALLEEASEANGRPVYILSDEAYSRILFDGNVMVTPASFYPRSLLVHTYSKSALAPGQRLGFLALPPDMPDKVEMQMAVMAVGAATGNWLPDAIMQYALPEIEAMSVDIAGLQSRRDRMVAALREQGYELHVPEATFYLLVKSPIADDAEFARRLRKDKVLVLPGTALDMPGYFRISLTATDDMVDRALPVFARAMEES
ncbi:MAG: aminotransferase class I/II-fold pyridoxal phosphate-dependent enzyme [Actinomycetota bacterium]